MRILLAVILTFFVTLTVGHPWQSGKLRHFKGKCGYEGCPDTPKDKLNIHLVPHTHDDVGWLKTVDQYYYGAHPMIQKAGVEFILDSVITELLKDPEKRFIYVESAFFFKWYDQQTEDLQNKVKDLVDQGRLEFIGGAWSMNDEATTHYQSLIDQFSHGLRKLNETFGECGRPRIGWQIDPFGHSKEMASIFAGMGFDGMFFARLDWRNKAERFKNKAGEMIWEPSTNLGPESDLFTGILYNHYSAPPGFCFDYLCNDEPIIDDGYEENVKARLDVFYNYITNMSKLYSTNNIMIPMGDDFNYQDAFMYYKNIDKIIKYSKDRKVNDMDVNIFYSTPSCYVKSINELGIEWPVEKNDFFPYATDIHTYWSGYFTSRSTLKRYERIGNNVLQICKKILAFNPTQSTDNLDLLREAMGIMQHHDAITGTEKQHVADDYAYLLHEAITGCDSVISENLNSIYETEKNLGHKLEFKPCHLINQSICDISSTERSFTVTLINPSNHPISDFIRIPVNGEKYEVKDYEGNVIPNYVIPVPEPVKKIPGSFTPAKNELVFEAKLGDITSYYIERKPSSKSHNIKNIKPEKDLTDVENSMYKLHFDNGILRTIQTKEDRETFKFEQEFVYFEGAAGNNQGPPLYENRSSGAYIYRPELEVKFTSPVKIEVYKYGPNNENLEIKQIVNNWVSQVIRLIESQKFIEFEWLVGPIPVEDKVGKEVVSHFKTDINSGDIFYTDSNGREMVQRHINKNPEELEKIASNYYPITTKLAIEDDKHRLAILTDRAQGAACTKSGECEILVHRRLLHDDAFGVGEALNETTVSRGKFHIIIGKKDLNLKEERKMQLKKLLSPLPVFSKVNEIGFEKWQNLEHKNALEIINADLPDDVNLMTLEPFGKNRVLLRLENILQVNEGGRTVEVDLTNILNKLKSKSINETTLDGNQWIDETKRMTWIKKGEEIETNEIRRYGSKGFDMFEDSKVSLKPMQIRTFIVDV